MRLLLTALLLVHGAAMGQTFACQYTDSAGLDWKNGRWQTTRFHTRNPFFLKLNGSDLDKKTVADFFSSSGASMAELHCQRHGVMKYYYSCLDGYGSFMFFDALTGKGGRSDIYGSAPMTSPELQDSLTVAPFTCQKM